MSEDISIVIVHSQRSRDVTLNGFICLEENIVDLEGNLVLPDGEHVKLDHVHVANKLQMFDAKFQQHHYKLVDLIDSSVELEANRGSLVIMNAE